jgi:hypothetical protein
MTHQTSKLEGENLDRAVALAEGWTLDRNGVWEAPTMILGHELVPGSWPVLHTPRWSTSWDLGGQIIDRERIHLTYEPDGGPTCCAAIPGRRAAAMGPTALIAAMRAYVASKLGEHVELP